MLRQRVKQLQHFEKKKRNVETLLSNFLTDEVTLFSRGGTVLLGLQFPNKYVILVGIKREILFRFIIS